MTTPEQQKLEDLVETAISAIGPILPAEYVAHAIRSTYILTPRAKVGIPDNDESPAEGGQVIDMTSEGCATEECGEDLGLTPQATSEDKLCLIRDTVEGQAPFGSDLANFQRRLRIILDL